MWKINLPISWSLTAENRLAYNGPYYNMRMHTSNVRDVRVRTIRVQYKTQWSIYTVRWYNFNPPHRSPLFIRPMGCILYVYIYTVSAIKNVANCNCRNSVRGGKSRANEWYIVYEYNICIYGQTEIFRYTLCMRIERDRGWERCDIESERKRVREGERGTKDSGELKRDGVR